MDDVPIPGWYLMAHEMGHHMGLQHTFNDGPRGLLEAIALGEPITGTVTQPDGSLTLTFGPPAIDTLGYAARPVTQQTRDNTVKWMNSFPCSWDPDSFDIIRPPDPKIIAKGVYDTGIDLGLGLGPYFGKSPCDVVTNVSIGKISGLSNYVNRTNPMSYTLCPAAGMHYSPQQVDVMVQTLQQPDHRLFVTNQVASMITCNPKNFVVGPAHLSPGDPIEANPTIAGLVAQGPPREPKSQGLRSLGAVTGIMPAH
jgi:hypothetical protein